MNTVSIKVILVMLDCAVQYQFIFFFKNTQNLNTINSSSREANWIDFIHEILKLLNVPIRNRIVSIQSHVNVYNDYHYYVTILGSVLKEALSLFVIVYTIQ